MQNAVKGSRCIGPKNIWNGVANVAEPRGRVEPSGSNDAAVGVEMERMQKDKKWKVNEVAYML